MPAEELLQWATSEFGDKLCLTCSWQKQSSVLVHMVAELGWAYIKVNEIPYNPLHDAGYRSIGCIPCTRPIAPDEEERAGRWAGSDKLECGIHLEGATTSD